MTPQERVKIALAGFWQRQQARAAERVAHNERCLDRARELRAELLPVHRVIRRHDHDPPCLRDRLPDRTMQQHTVIKPARRA